MLKLTAFAFVAVFLTTMAAEIASAQSRTCTSTYNPYTRTTTTHCW